MALTKPQKQKVVEDLKDKIAKSKAIILVGVSGVKVKDLSQLRRELKEKDGNLKVTKKTLASIAFKDNKLDFEKEKFKSELGLVFGYSDEITPAKKVYQFSKENKNLEILGGFIDNKFIEAKDIITLAQLPTKEELLARLVGTLSAPMSGLVRVMEGNIKGLLLVLSGIKK